MAEQSQVRESKSTISTFIVMICTTLSRLLGFFRTAAITAIFGANGTADVINLTFAIPNNLRKLMAEGALSSAFIPVISEAINNTQSDKANSRSKKITENLISLQLIVIIPICLASILFAEPLIKYVLTQFQNPWQIELSIKLFRFFIIYLLFISISAVIMGVLNSHGRFFVPAFTPIIFSVAVISSILFLHKTYGVFSMVIGVLVGGVGQIVFQYPLFKKIGYSFKLNFNFKNTDFVTVLRQWGPVLATSSVYTINQQVAFLLASGLLTGSTSALTYALVFWQLPFGIFSASITTVLFPQMSKQVNSGDIEGLRISVQYGIRFLFVLLIPSAVFLGLLGKEIISVAIQRGMFTAENTIMTASVLTGYSFGLFSVGAFNFLQRYFYSIRNFRTPFFIALGVCILDISLSLILKETFLGVTGLAVAHSISFTLGFLILFYFTYKNLSYVHIPLLIKTIIKVVVALIPVIVFIILFNVSFGNWWLDGSTGKNFMLLLVVFSLATVILLGMYKLVGIEMLSLLLDKMSIKKRKPK